MASSIPACKTAVLAILAARSGLTGVKLTRTGPTKDSDFAASPGNDVELIFLGRSENQTDWAELGTGRRTETYLLDITVWAEKWGDDPQTVEERAFALWGEVEDALRTDIRASPSVLRTAGVFQFATASYTALPGPAAPEKWGVRIDARVQFQARNV